MKAASAFFSYTKGGSVQRLVHALKYEGCKEVGEFAGKKMAESWMEHPELMPDIIVPVPMHVERKRQRGYNQAELLAEAMSSVLQVELDSRSLIRNSRAASQTTKRRYDRFTSLDGKFSVSGCQSLAGKRIMLVDDVITTGATAMACLGVLRNIPGSVLMVAAMASAGR